MKDKIEFDLEKWYTTTQVVTLSKEGYFPFRSLAILYGLIHSGKLKVVARGEGKKKKFYIQGKELTRYAESQQITIHQNNGKQMQKGSSKT